MKIGCSHFAGNRVLASVALMLAALTGRAQSYYPQSYFQSPMDTPLYLSAPFGSLRDNHFHSGMDIRTYEKEGLPVYAVADGYVSRIKVQSTAYGKALYIDHPNGYTSVYGHLQRYEGEVGAYIRKYQYQEKSFEFDHFPGRALPVRKGQIIGYSGNSGTSSGPHLHFEIRSTKSEEPLNPLLFGIPVTDLYGPMINRVAVYNLDQNRPLLKNDFLVSRMNVENRDSVWHYTDTVDVAKGTIGFGMEAYDMMVNTAAEYSIYRAETFFDGQRVFGFTLDRIAFSETRCINAHIDYEVYRREGMRLQKCFLDDGNSIRIYNYMRGKGRIRLNDSKVHEVVMAAADFAGRKFKLSFYVKGFDAPSVPVAKAACQVATFYPGRLNTWRNKDIAIEVQAKALYDTLGFCLDQDPAFTGGLSPAFRVHDPYTPLHRNMAVSIRMDNAPAPLQEKLLLGYYTKEGSMRSAGGEYKDGWVTARSTNFGNFVVTLDTTAPQIRPLNIDKGERVKDTLGMRFRIEDGFSGIGSYEVTVNGQWVIAEYDAKNDLLIWIFDEKTPRNSKATVAVTVTDRKGNKALWSREVTVAAN